MNKSNIPMIVKEYCDYRDAGLIILIFAIKEPKKVRVNFIKALVFNNDYIILINYNKLNMTRRSLRSKVLYKLYLTLYTCL